MKKKLNFNQKEKMKLSEYEILNKLNVAMGTLLLSDAFDKMPSQLSGARRKHKRLAPIKVVDPLIRRYEETGSGTGIVNPTKFVS